MEGAAVVKRELYLDVTENETELEEIYLYQVDFLEGASFRTKEFVLRIPEGELSVEEAEPAELTEQFYEVWKQLLSVDIKTECYATDAVLVMSKLFLPLRRKYPDAQLFAGNSEETLYDCISMGRVVSMSVFDEKQHLGAGIRRRMKEKYHVLSEEVKRRKPFHIFLSGAEMTACTLTVTDSALNVTEECRLPGSANEEQTAAKLSEVLKRYPEADILTDAATEKLYRMFLNMNLFMHTRPVKVIYSLTSMLHALGKEKTHIFASEQAEQKEVSVYRNYIKMAENIRFGQAHEENVIERLVFYLPARIPSDKAWKKQFKKNQIWKPSVMDGTGYEINTSEEIKAKYTIKSGDEQFVLRVTNISIHRCLREYAVMELETENRRYTGTADRARIRELGGSMCLEPHPMVLEPLKLPDLLELRIKTKSSSYVLSAATLPETEDGQTVWLNGLFLLGRKKKGKKQQFFLENCSRNMFVSEEKAEAFCTALVRDEYLRYIEKELALAAEPKKKSHREGKLTGAKKRQIRRLYEAFRYLVVSYGEEQREQAETLFTVAEEQCGTRERMERLLQKFQLYQ